MLVHLKIDGFAVIDRAELAFTEGLNVLTGETGAGKSLVVGALSLLRGGRSSSDLVRQGCNEASVEAIFDLRHCDAARQTLLSSGLEPTDELLLRRTVSQSGRSRVYVNGTLSTVSQLAHLAAQLFDISGQNEHQALSDRTVQRQILDAVAKTDLTREKIAAAYTRMKTLIELRARVTIDETTRQTRLDYLRHQINEIEAIDLREGEEEQLAADVKRLRSVNELQQITAGAEVALYSGDEALIDHLSRIERELTGLTELDAALVPLVSQLQEARMLLQDVGTSLARYTEQLIPDPEQLSQLEARLDTLYMLKRKHGPSVSTILQRLGEMRSEIENLEEVATAREKLARELTDVRATAQELATALSRSRSAASKRLAKDVSAQLADLGMPGARLTIEVVPVAPRQGDDEALTFGNRQLTSTGWDQVDFCFSAHAEAPAQPVGRVASGGELSRLMLALKQVLGKHDPVPTSVYDEIDAGISGAAADVVGNLLSKVASSRQVICVTHLPQVCAYADTHFRVEKHRRDDKTESIVHQLSDTDRIEEVARMLAASTVTNQARANAKALVESARSQPTQ